MPFLFDPATRAITQITSLPGKPSDWLNVTLDIEPYKPVWGIMETQTRVMIFQTEDMALDVKNSKITCIRNGNPNSVTF